ncbi:exodeoxyribonuclease VII small subunit [Adlercreutzia sp. ZJ473]|uniref:exodeoxyribonuclease VII small subunit n=1 Tax=Adlercreutzia sp. ZJ473 TaxID=2722822 RepID=UPI0015543698|nr:exodeoxyribonuclease VII small subunit [Adlercreutzia sp. ZJ473]
MNEELKPVEELTFRQAMAELEGVVNVLESNTLELEESLESYARGVSLLASLQKRLDAAEQQVDVLMGELAPAPDDATQDTTLQKA